MRNYSHKMNCAPMYGEKMSLFIRVCHHYQCHWSFFDFSGCGGMKINRCEISSRIAFGDQHARDRIQLYPVAGRSNVSFYCSSNRVHQVEIVVRYWITAQLCFLMLLRIEWYSWRNCLSLILLLYTLFSNFAASGETRKKNMLANE